MEKDLVRQALEVSRNNQTAAARLLGLTRSKFRVLMKEAGKKAEEKDEHRTSNVQHRILNWKR